MRDTRQQSTQGYSNLIGIPYGDANCFDIVRMFYREELGIDIKDLNRENLSADDRAAVESLIVASKGDFEKVDSPEYGDIIVIKVMGLESHVAVYIGNDRMLHTYHPEGSSCVEHLGKWKTRIAGFYRLKD